MASKMPVGDVRQSAWWRPPWDPTRRSQRMRWWIAGIFVALTVNYWLASRATEAPPRIHIPYSPFFLGQVRNGNVRDITSRGTAIQGNFRRRARYGDSRASTRFTTEIPLFANGDALTSLLQKKAVVVNAVPLETGLVWWKSLLFGFGPTILIVGLLIWFLRRARSAGGMLGALGRSKARRYKSRRRAASNSPTLPGSMRRKRSWARSSTSCATPTSTEDWADTSQAACC